MTYNQKNQKSSLWHSPIMLFVMFLAVLIFMYNMIGLIEKMNETKKKKAIVSAQINTLKEREATLSSDIAKVKTDIGQEEALRAKYQVVKNGEKLVVIVDEEPKSAPEIKKSIGFLDYFKNLFK